MGLGKRGEREPRDGMGVVGCEGRLGVLVALGMVCSTVLAATGCFGFAGLVTLEEDRLFGGRGLRGALGLALAWGTITCVCLLDVGYFGLAVVVMDWWSLYWTRESTVVVGTGIIDIHLLGWHNVVVELQRVEYVST